MVVDGGRTGGVVVDGAGRFTGCGAVVRAGAAARFVADVARVADVLVVDVLVVDVEDGVVVRAAEAAMLSAARGDTCWTPPEPRARASAVDAASVEAAVVDDVVADVVLPVVAEVVPPVTT